MVARTRGRRSFAVAKDDYVDPPHNHEGMAQAPHKVNLSLAWDQRVIIAAQRNGSLVIAAARMRPHAIDVV
jgi:hypothetical protein